MWLPCAAGLLPRASVAISQHNRGPQPVWQTRYARPALSDTTLAFDHQADVNVQVHVAPNQLDKPGEGHQADAINKNPKCAKTIHSA